MKKLLSILIVIPFLLLGAGVFVLIVAAGAALIWFAFHFRELIILYALDKGMETAEKVTGEKLTR